MELTKHEEIEKSVLDDVLDGIYKADEKVLSENKLADKFGVSRMTARKALDNLVIRGYLYKVKGKGTFVRDRKNRDDIYLDEMIGFTKRVERNGKTPRTDVITFEKKMPSLDIAEKLEISQEEEIFYIERVRNIDDEPVILETTYMPVYVSPDLTKEDIERSKYSYLREHGHIIDEMIKEYIPVIPSSKVRKILGVDKNNAMFKIELTSILETGKKFEYTKLYYNQNKYRFLQKIKNR